MTQVPDAGVGDAGAGLLETDPVEELERDIARRRRRLGIGIAGTFMLLVLGVLVALTFRDRTVHLIGGPETVLADIEGLARFRLVSPHGAQLLAGPGTYPIRGELGPARPELHVTYAPWTSEIAAPVQQGQCLIVASGSSFYEGGEDHDIHIHEVTREPREVALPALFADIVVTHPCDLPGSIRLMDTILVIATVPCAEAPDSVEDARAIVVAQLLGCPP